MKKPEFRILIVGAGRMAATHVKRFMALPDCRVVAAVDTHAARLNEFCKTHEIPNQFPSTEIAIDWGKFDVVSVVTPDAFHASACIPCLAAGYPVLCEKPLADSVPQAMHMAKMAQQADVVNMVNLSYRRSGALDKARQLVDSGELGELRHVEAAYLQSWLVSPYWGDWRSEEAWLWRLSTEHGSLGVLGDVGIHILDFTLRGTGLGISALQCRLQNFNKAPGNRIGKYSLDANDSCIVSAEFDNGALGVIHMSRYATGHQNTLELILHGTLGACRVHLDHKGDRLGICVGKDRDAQIWREREYAEKPDTYERFIDAVRSNNPGSPDFTHAAMLQKLIEQCFDSHEKACWVTSAGY